MRSIVRIACAASLVLAATGAGAIGLGTATLDSGLGEPLRFSVPVTVQPEDDVGCVQIRARGDELPSVFNTRSRVVRSGEGATIEVSSAQAVNEPAIGVVVSVGCTSPVAREFVFFLDPPITAPTTARSPAARSVVQPTVPARLAAAKPRRPSASAGRTRAGGAVVPATRSAATTRAERASRGRPPIPTPDADAVPSSARPSPAPSSRPAGSDRLSVVPTEPPGATVAPSGAGGAATSDMPPPAAPSAATGAADAASTAREQALRQQQDELQARLKSLSDQVAALRAQTAGLAARNATLEQSNGLDTLQWLLIALAVLAVLVAAWMAWRYTQLRRSLEGSPWWSGNTMQAPPTGDATQAGGPPTGLAPMEAGTRMAPRPATRTDARSSQVAVNEAPGPALERSRPIARSQNYPPAIESDFTVSDIEAAMAAVRTVSTPRKPPVATLTESDLGALGGPTMPSPFSEPPSPAPSPAPPTDLGARFMDLDIPPKPATTSSRSQPRPQEPTSAPLDFSLDIPTNFDPLATDSHKRTIVERDDAGSGVDFELPATASALDFELPSTVAPASIDTPDSVPPRHGASALGNLFASGTGPLGPDTILDLDDGQGSPLSTTEVDRFTATMPLDAVAIDPTSTQGRMTRFAEVMDQVDESAPDDPLRAIAQLRQYVLRDETIPTLLWLRLFELYKAVDKKPVYDALAEHFARRYGRPMVGWSESLADRAPQTPLTAMRELDAEIEASWGTEAGLARLQTLLCDRRQSDAIVFNAVLQRDLLDSAKIFLVDRGTPAA